MREGRFRRRLSGVGDFGRVLAERPEREDASVTTVGDHAIGVEDTHDALLREIAVFALLREDTSRGAVQRRGVSRRLTAGDEREQRPARVDEVRFRFALVVEEFMVRLLFAREVALSPSTVVLLLGE